MSNASSQTVNITIPKELLKQVDALAKRDYTSRSDIIRQALLAKIRKTSVDEWGDEGHWETVVDFREINPDGVPADEVIAALKNLEKIDEQNRKVTAETQSQAA
jgi:Arc/MetJ-type ribon-helix-helix transcriptional regulator